MSEATNQRKVLLAAAWRIREALSGAAERVTEQFGGLPSGVVFAIDDDGDARVRVWERGTAGVDFGFIDERGRSVRMTYGCGATPAMAAVAAARGLMDRGEGGFPLGFLTGREEKLRTEVESVRAALRGTSKREMYLEAIVREVIHIASGVNPVHTLEAPIDYSVAIPLVRWLREATKVRPAPPPAWSVEKDDLVGGTVAQTDDTSTPCEEEAMGYPMQMEEMSDEALKREMARRGQTMRPHIVCLCGSTRFMDAFHAANLRETLKGKIVLTVGCSKHDLEGFNDPSVKSDGSPRDEEVDRHLSDPALKRRLDDLHKRKIDLADEILVLNVGGYVGDSTRSEIEYAQAQGKHVRWLESAEDGYGNDFGGNDLGAELTEETAETERERGLWALIRALEKERDDLKWRLDDLSD